MDYIDMLKNQGTNEEHWFKIYNLTKTMKSLNIYILEFKKKHLKLRFPSMVLKAKETQQKKVFQNHKTSQ